MPARVLLGLVAFGPLLYGAVGVAGIVLGGNFLDYSVLSSDPVKSCVLCPVGAVPAPPRPLVVVPRSWVLSQLLGPLPLCLRKLPAPTGLAERGADG